MPAWFVTNGTSLPRNRPSLGPRPRRRRSWVRRALQRLVRRLFASGRAQDGFTLVEVLVAASLSVVVLGAVLTTLETSQRVQSRDAEWALMVQEGRVGLSRMLGDIRQATSLKSTSSNSIEFYATLGGRKEEVLYECQVAQSGTSYYECVRLAWEAGATKPALSAAIPVIKNVLNPTAVFTYSNTSVPTASDVVNTKIELPAAGTLKLASAANYSHHIVLSNDAYIRNLNLGA
jgi:prepilin-type N-terminal cleavage/methylation domain-containing protein